METQTVVKDDFTRIEGIGPKINDRFHNAGYNTFAQLAAASPSKIRKVIPDLGGLIKDEKIAGWISRAGELVQESEPAEPPQNAITRGNHQHYATFTVKLLLNEENNVRRTHITHVQAGSEDAWASWDQTRMVEFIVQHAELRVPVPMPAGEPSAEPSTDPVIAKAVDPDSSNNDTQISPVRELIFDSTVNVCAKNRQVGRCLFEQEIINQNFERDGKLVIEGLLRRSGDKQLNEHILILVDNQIPPVFESFDKPGNEEEQFTVEIPLKAGEHTVVARHADVSEKPKSAESVHADLKIWFESSDESSPLTPPVKSQPTVEISKLTVIEGVCGADAPSNCIIGTDQDWCIQLEWELTDATEQDLTGNWLVQVFLECMGRGNDFDLPAYGEKSLRDFTEEEAGVTFKYRHEIEGPSLPEGVYKLVVAVSTWKEEIDAPGDWAHFVEGPLLQFYNR